MPDEPVGARARQRRVVHRQRLGRRPQLAERGADRRIVERRQPQALDGTAVAAQVDDLAGDQFALAVGVGGDDQLGRLRQKRFDDLELRGGLRLDLDPPLLGNDGQLLQRPALERRVIDLGCCRFDEMADAPGDVTPEPLRQPSPRCVAPRIRPMSLPWEGFSHRTAACPSIRIPVFMELLGSRMPSACWGSSKQAACGGDRFHADGMAWAGWRAAGGVRAGSRDVRERVEAGGR
jgi:hypothetical protein